MHAPLWSWHMEGIKHIRGILYEEEMSADPVPKPSPSKKPKWEKFEGLRLRSKKADALTWCWWTTTWRRRSSWTVT